MMSDLPVLAFQDVAALRRWLEVNHATSAGILVRIYKRDSGIASVTFEDVLDEGLCFGWSESRRLKGDSASYLQQFTPRKTIGTASERNRKHVEHLIEEGRMTAACLRALSYPAEGSSGRITYQLPWILRQPPARLLAITALNRSKSARSLIVSP